jgi:hypothetical protein
MLARSPTQSQARKWTLTLWRLRSDTMGYVYLGSHNFTPSAWGRRSGSRFTPIPGCGSLLYSGIDMLNNSKHDEPTVMPLMVTKVHVQVQYCNWSKSLGAAAQAMAYSAFLGPASAGLWLCAEPYTSLLICLYLALRLYHHHPRLKIYAGWFILTCTRSKTGFDGKRSYSRLVCG